MTSTIDLPVTQAPAQGLWAAARRAREAQAAAELTLIAAQEQAGLAQAVGYGDGLGSAVGRLQKAAQDARTTASHAAQAAVLSSRYPRVETPLRSVSYLVGPAGDRPPVIVRQRVGHGSSDYSYVECTVAAQRYVAPLPIPPTAILDELARARRIAPNAEFSLIYAPAWEPVAQSDPILLAEVGGHTFEIARWGGDLDLLDEWVIRTP